MIALTKRTTVMIHFTLLFWQRQKQNPLPTAWPCQTFELTQDIHDQILKGLHDSEHSEIRLIFAVDKTKVIRNSWVYSSAQEEGQNFDP